MKTPPRRAQILDELETQHPDADTELHYRNAVRAAGGDDPVGAVDRRSASTWSRRRCSSAIPTRAALAKATTGRARAADPLDRLLPREVESAARHGAGAGRAARRRGAGRHGRAGRAARRRPQDGERRARPRARRAGAAGRSPRAARREPHRHRRVATIRSSSSSSCAARCRRSAGRATSDTLILHGRRICRPKPLCDQCVVRDDCDYFQTVVARSSTQADAAPATGAAERERRKRSTQPWTADDSSSSSLRRSPRFRAASATRCRTSPSSSRTSRRASCSTRWRSSRPTRCSASIRARRSPSGAGATATRCPTASCSSRVRTSATREDEDDLVVAIGETLIHEIGHYFGLSEEEIEEIEEQYWRGEGDADRGAGTDVRPCASCERESGSASTSSSRRGSTRSSRAIDPQPDDTFLEIGPGRGALTRPLAGAREAGHRVRDRPRPRRRAPRPKPSRT